ncbi:MAG: hypothetical protein D6731_05735 [Planctomycetota bacterium]|nr:MAG: hypothetical protein D6731_05735 [Planctomycetota bacterium]
MARFVLLAPLKAEADALASALGPGEAAGALAPPAALRRHGGVLCGWCGMGRAPAEAAVAAIAKTRPAALLFAGVAGALAPGLRCGDVVWLESALAGEEEERWEAPAPLAAASSDWPRGSVLTVEALVGAPAQKRLLGESFAADLVDMETFWAARAARRAGLPFAAVRVVLDERDEELPDFSAGLDPVGRPRLLAFGRRLLRGPRDVLALPRLARSFGVAERSLCAVARAVRAAIAES